MHVPLTPVRALYRAVDLYATIGVVSGVRRFGFGDTALPKTGAGKTVKRQLRGTFRSGKETCIQG